MKQVPTLILDDTNDEVWRRLREGVGVKVWIWGTGAFGRRFLRGARLLGVAESVEAFVDTDPVKEGEEIEGLSVRSPSELVARKKTSDAPIVVVASTAWREIEGELIDMGREEGREYAVLRGLT